MSVLFHYRIARARFFENRLIEVNAKYDGLIDLHEIYWRLKVVFVFAFFIDRQFDVTYKLHL